MSFATVEWVCASMPFFFLERKGSDKSLLHSLQLIYHKNIILILNYIILFKEVIQLNHLLNVSEETIINATDDKNIGKFVEKNNLGVEQEKKIKYLIILI